ncbi:unnamed protein product [Cylindrotheca closterium]|uniref:DUF6824 domain-containing protein n=1 Tax=Cylindrotheca closterium TaxID=2856 RepID=A0AAD2FEG5_9STRA|nr:unnamed protein product [Cylindrotheca closterium]
MSTEPRMTFCGMNCPGGVEPAPYASQFAKHLHSHQHSETNEDHQGRSDVEAILVQGMQNLTFDELQREQEDLHGVSAESQEDTKVMDKLLKSLTEHLHRLKKGTVYESAEERNPPYVCQRKFQILFLRGNRYDPKAAAEKIISFYSLKKDLFGTERLVRDITLQDMDEDDMETLMCGSAQVASCLDRSGRVIVLAVPGLRKYKSIKNELRYLYYLSMKVLESQESQKKGVVFVSYFVDKYKDSKNGEGFNQTMKLMLSIPFNIAGFHWCLDDHTQMILGKAAFSVMPPRLQAKTKLHFGSHVECQYLLASYGIPREALAFSSSYNDLDLSYHRYWLKQCAQQESNGNNPSQREPVSSVHCTPKENDVLCIGRRASGAGNKRLMKMAVSFSDSYDLGTVKSRRAILNCMMDEIRKHGGRFLKPDISAEGEGSWIEVEEKEMRLKIGQTFRNLRRRRAGVPAAGNVVATPAPPSSVLSAVKVKPDDVLFGKNNPQRGNQLLQSLIEQMAAEYDSSNRGQKKQLASRLVCKIKESGGRFLKPMNDGTLEIVSDKVAEQKVSVHFRNLRRKKR